MRYVADNTHGTERTEVLCSRCDSHIGHILQRRPATHQRYCMNSLALDFVPGKTFGALGN